MGDLRVRISNLLNLEASEGTHGFNDERIEELERVILECQSLHKNNASNSVADSIYDALWDILKRVSPNSEILKNIWEDGGDNPTEEYLDLYIKNPMMSIETAKSYDCNEIVNFINRMPEETVSYFASYKINGHGIRVVFNDGVLVSATTRARGKSGAGRDITNHLKVILGGDYNENLADYGLVELRGELCLKLDKLDEARKYNPEIKSAFSAVASLIRPSASEEELKLLDFLCYGFIIDGFTFSTRDEEFYLIEQVGLKTPQYQIIEGASRGNLLSTIQSVIESFEEFYEEFDYFCDGVVFEVNDRGIFHELGVEGNHNLGNIALKVGLWKQDQYVGYIQKILWTPGKSKLSPVAIVADEPNMAVLDDNGDIVNMPDLGVSTAQGNVVRRVPLYEPKNMLILNAYEGYLLHFRYGGEAGVVPCFPDGRLLKEDSALSIINGDPLDWSDIED